MPSSWIDRRPGPCSTAAPAARLRALGGSLGTTLLLATACLGCDADATSSGDALFPTLRVTQLTPTPLLVGSTVDVVGDGFVGGEIATYELDLVGAVDGAPVQWRYGAQRRGEQRLRVRLDDRLFASLAGDRGAFVGDAVVRRVIGDVVHEARAPVTLPLARTLTPTLVGLSATELYPGDPVELVGDGFLRAGEGTSLVRFDGTFTTATPAASRPVVGLVVPAEVTSEADRTRLAFALTPDVFGVRPGRFTGTVSVVNSVGDGGVELASEAIAVAALDLRAPIITSLSPTTASRGQRVYVGGRGLLPPDDLLQAAIVLVLDGVFEPRRGASVAFTGVDALVVYPDSHGANTELSAVLRVTPDEDGGLTGLGARAGVFTGRVTPLLLWGDDAIEGQGLPFTLEIVNPRQVVYVRTLPAFSDALIAFGLLAEREAILARVQQVLERDYAGVNITFAFTEPTEFAEYTIVEVGGEDPNGSHLFGLDNTIGKDVGNLRFDDVIGGFNAETRSRNYAAYGGIFVAELMNLSPTVGFGHALASPRFDEIFAPVAPILGGVAARAGEARGLDARAAAIATAARVLGNLIGTTITHEVGHSLGLTAIDGQVHNNGDNPGWIMDAGQFRPFAERAEIDGVAPAVFSPFNRAYLEDVLPLDGPG